MFLKCVVTNPWLIDSQTLFIDIMIRLRAIAILNISWCHPDELKQVGVVQVMVNEPVALVNLEGTGQVSFYK